MRLFQVDAFADQAFGGNPAAVCLVSGDASAEWMQAVAAEMNLSETAFLVGRGDGVYGLRWFTPAVEVDLCGHATLASGLVVLTALEPGRRSVTFHSKSGPLTVERAGDDLSMDFPSRAPERCPPSPELSAALGAAPSEVWKSRDLMGVFDTEQQVRVIATLRPVGYVGTPSFLKILLERARSDGLDLSCLRKALVSGEAFPRSLAEELKHEFGIDAYQSYATADLGLIAYETRAREGLVIDEGVLVEIVRPGENGWVCEPHDAAGLAGLLATAAARITKPELAEAARATAEGFGIDEMAAKLTALYATLGARAA